jgi:hypothetical protein
VAHIAIHDGIVFIEGAIDAAVYGPPVQCDFRFKFGSQLKSLTDVKDNLAAQAKREGYNSIMNFTYGQKSRLIAIDSISFWGKGRLVTISEEKYNGVVQKPQFLNNFR